MAFEAVLGGASPTVPGKEVRVKPHRTDAALGALAVSRPALTQRPTAAAIFVLSFALSLLSASRWRGGPCASTTAAG
jgi:hypothetical protein